MDSGCTIYFSVTGSPFELPKLKIKSIVIFFFFKEKNLRGEMSTAF